MGVDPLSDNLEIAREWAAVSAPGANITFAAGDSHRLDYPDNTFDVVYSHTMAHFLLDPVRAFREQKRVAKPGGWIIASGVRDPGILTRYPTCPNWNKAWSALSRCFESVRERYESSGDDAAAFLAREKKQAPHYAVHWDMHAGRKCPGRMRQAGLGDQNISIKADFISFAGSESMDVRVLDLLPTDDADSTEKEGDFQRVITGLYAKMIAEDLIDQRTVDLAVEEARNWYRDPQAFHYWVLIFVAGRA